jgi:hypothetical protein
MAKKIIEEGSVFTDRGNEAIKELHSIYQENIGGVLAHHVDDITTVITFLCLLSGLLPN